MGKKTQRIIVRNVSLNFFLCFFFQLTVASLIFFGGTWLKSFNMFSIHIVACKFWRILVFKGSRGQGIRGCIVVPVC